MKYSGKGTAASAIALLLAVAGILWRCYGDKAWTSPDFWIAGALLAIAGTMMWTIGRRLDRMTQLALKDALTGLYNRRYIARTLPELLRQARTSGRKFTVSMVDVNEFKQLNDVYGHQAGDVLLQHIAVAISKCVKDGDIAARWGGDEFIVICSQGERDRRMLREQIDERLKQLSAKYHVDLSVSIGTAVYPDDAASIEELVSTADKRMFDTKCKRKEPPLDISAKIG